MITIRQAVLEDAKDISFLGKKTFDQSFGHLFLDREDLITYLDVTFSYQKIKSSMSKSHNIYWLVLDQESPIGYAKLQLNSPSAFIKNNNISKLQKIYMLNGTSSKGIGGKLQQIIFDKAIEEGSQYLWLSVLKENERAVAFYHRNEYQIIGEHPFTIGKQRFDFWVMSKELF
ncbi:GNAT family N-acetyltransferase [Aquimarina gracilis]|uniref:GNAT family N-acetyltransferase n=1 Tax=Aquimarina gracilis TaxID=874422 RepID=A0ABU5ZXN8_9FLAO|nr:GNAT family N-acetyltransferase [Aquimarina gracilis]MEB3346639.1 GNAT family N-acetyltransferase [Aquimarina gracilis]